MVVVRAIPISIENKPRFHSIVVYKKWRENFNGYCRQILWIS